VNPELQRSLLRRLVDLKRDGATAMAAEVRHQPAAAYTDPAHLAREFQALFRGHPLVLGLGADLRECGEYRAIDVAGVPVLLVRGENAEIRAFLNSCRHRGSPVAEGAGMAGRVFKCPYHAWCYDIAGRLLGQPLAQSAFAEVPHEELGLVPLPVAEAGGLIMLIPSADAAPFSGTEQLAGLAPELDEQGLQDLTLFAEQHHTVRCNWKQPYETFLEAYHVFALHRTTLAKQILSTPMLADFYGPHGRGLLTGRDTHKALNSIDESQWSLNGSSTNLVYWLFPNAILSLPMSGHAELWLVYPHEGDPGRCRVHLKFYVPGERDDARASFWQRMLDYSSTIVLNEDFDQQAAIYRGLSSGSHPGLVFGRNEPALIHYHQSIDAALTSPRTGRGTA
jgi:phenylpropionate dioxygenase-like ring-hydroxylating dioxygenase large terminal subunit